MMTTDTIPSQALRRMRAWAAVFGGALLVVVGAAGALLVTANDEARRADVYGVVLGEQANVIDPLCEVAGPSVNKAGSKAQKACQNVSQGLPPVPVPVEVEPPQKGADGVGIAYSRQVDRCFIEVGLSDGTSTRFGPFCGQDGSPGPTGESGSVGPTGESGAPGVAGDDGSPGIGIRDIQTNGCNVDVTLTDDTTRTVGPFCGSPPGEYTEVRPDGSEKHCRRDGGADTAPRYVCTTTAPTTSETVRPTDDMLPLPTN